MTDRYDEEMKLPPGKTCADCTHLRRCLLIFGGDAKNTSCDFHPSRFHERSASK